MNNRKKVAGLSLTSTIMQGITLFITASILIILIVLCFALFGIMGDSIGSMENIDPDSVTAGWEVLFGTAGGFLGIIAGVMLIFLSISMIGPVIAGIVVFIYGIRTYQKRDTDKFKRMARNDSIVKLVISAVMIIISLFFLPSFGSEQDFVEQLVELVSILVFDIPYIVTIVVSIMALRDIKYIEELPDDSHPQYIESIEDNSPYSWQ